MDVSPVGACARGLWAERLAEAVLEAGGYHCLDRRFRAPGGEIDLVVRRGSVLAFVEVKARRAGGAGPPECFVDRAKRARVRRAAAAWLTERAAACGCRHDAPEELRFDVVAIEHQGPGGGLDIRHLVGVF